MDKFFSHIATITPISKKSQLALQKKLHIFYLEKKEILLKPEELCDYVYFVKEGLIRVFRRTKGKDVTEFFGVKNVFFSLWDSLERKIPAQVSIEAVETSIIYGVSYKDLQQMSKTIADFNELYHKIKAQIIIECIDWIRMLNTKTATERYQDFVRLYPMVIQKAPLQHIASYLGITPETLSRIRHEQIKIERAQKM